MWYKPNASSSSPLANGPASYWCSWQCAPCCGAILLSDKRRQKKTTLTCDAFCANRRGASLRISDFEVDVLWDYRLETVVISFICHFRCLLSPGSDYWRQYEAQSWQRALGLTRVMHFQLKELCIRKNSLCMLVWNRFLSECQATTATFIYWLFLCIHRWRTPSLPATALPRPESPYSGSRAPISNHR